MVKKFNILVVDDESAICYLLTQALQNEQTEVWEATTGTRAIQIVEQHPLDLIFLDVSLPDYTGFDVCKKIRQSRHNAKTPIIMMSGMDVPMVRADGLGAGATDFMGKPLNILKLRDYVSSYLKSKTAVGNLSENQSQTVSDHDQTRRLIKESQDLFHALINNSPSIIFIKDLDGRYLQYNDTFQILFNKNKIALIGRTDKDLFDSRIAELLRESDRQDIEQKQSIKLEQVFPTEEQVRTYLSVKFPLTNSLGEVFAVCTIATDITERKHAEEQLTYLASHDMVTGLRNRHYFTNRLASFIGDGGDGAVLYIDLDNFKVINDTLGHATGDRALAEIARIVQSKMNRPCEMSRLGGDEFSMILPKADQDEAEKVAKHTLELISKITFAEGGETFWMGASIGIAMYDGASATNEVISQADMAGYAAKRKGGGHYEVFRPKEMKGMRQDYGLTAKLNHAIANGKLELWFQPIVDLKTRKTEYYEALVRLRDENNEIIMPGVFLPIAERTGIIYHMDRYVIKLSAAYLKSNPDLKLSINLSAQSIEFPDLFSYIQDTFSQAGVKPSRAVFELTETMIASDLAQARTFVEQLQREGFLFALDDFGSGSSSLKYLRNLPANVVKIDGVFIRDLAKDIINQTMVRSINEMSHLLNMRTVAEFIEDEEIVKKLIEIGVDHGQGYFFSKPRSAIELGFTVPGA